MDELSSAQIAKIFANAGDSVNVINTDTAKGDNETEAEWKARIQRNVEHLETIKAYKQEDETTSIWTTESFTAIDAAITKGKKVYS